MGWVAIYRREMLILTKKIGNMGYVFSTAISPFIYLFAFGLGLGDRVKVEGGYLPFLVSGIIGITVMMNSFQQTSSSVSVGKLYFHTFQSVVLSPVGNAAVVLGIVMAGVVRGLFFGALIFVMAWLFFGAGVLGSTGIVGMILGALCFSAMGTVVGLLVKHPDDVSLVNNFFITPMTFFGGSFFPLQNLPAWLGTIAGLFPIGSLNLLIRSSGWNGDSLAAAGILAGLTGIFFYWSVWLYSRYSE
ncbi:MAG TPA: ABC transporter permease [Negativicutes bacterium]|nr:ABC transporter permease [Negativicutes bacterium]